MAIADVTIGFESSLTLQWPVGSWRHRKETAIIKSLEPNAYLLHPQMLLTPVLSNSLLDSSLHCSQPSSGLNTPFLGVPQQFVSWILHLQLPCLIYYAPCCQIHLPDTVIFYVLYLRICCAPPLTKNRPVGARNQGLGKSSTTKVQHGRKLFLGGC